MPATPNYGARMVVWRGIVWECAWITTTSFLDNKNEMATKSQVDFVRVLTVEYMCDFFQLGTKRMPLESIRNIELFK